MKRLASYKKEIEGLVLEDLLRWALEKFKKSRIILSSSFSIEDQVITSVLSRITKDFRIATLDTGRHFEETYKVWEETQKKYNIKYEVGFPNNDEISSVISEKGINFFKKSIKDRETCCRIRKIEPLKKILSTVDCWITGLRAKQSVTRKDIQILEWDYRWNIYKLNPLANYTETDVWEIIDKEKIPYNKLQKKGFKSIGCECCTRAVKEGEDIRSGRWWWELPEHKECGLHKR